MSFRKLLSLFIIGLLSITEVHARKKRKHKEHTEEQKPKAAQHSSHSTQNQAPKTDHAHSAGQTHGQAAPGGASNGAVVQPAGQKPGTVVIPTNLAMVRAHREPKSRSRFYLTPSGSDKINITKFSDKDYEKLEADIRLRAQGKEKQMKRKELPHNAKLKDKNVYFMTSKGNWIDITDLSKKAQDIMLAQQTLSTDDDEEDSKKTPKKSKDSKTKDSKAKSSR